MAFKECDKPGPEKFQPIFIETKKIEARIPCTVENHDKNPLHNTRSFNQEMYLKSGLGLGPLFF